MNPASSRPPAAFPRPRRPIAAALALLTLASAGAVAPLPGRGAPATLPPAAGTGSRPAAASTAIVATAPLQPNVLGRMDAPLRYHPDAGAFVIENGPEYFNRPLYGGHTAFRVDAGDQPEFSLYLPGRGGNLRLGWSCDGSTRWLQTAAQVVARYVPGAMHYTVSDPALGAHGTIELDVVALAATEGLVLRVETRDIMAPFQLLAAYGGVTGERGKRDGDIGTEAVPIGDYFQLRPEFCSGNQFELSPRHFILRAKAIATGGTTDPEVAWELADAQGWSDAAALLGGVADAAEPPARPVAVARIPVRPGKPSYLALQRLATGAGADDGAEDLATYREVTAPGTGEGAKARPAALQPLYAPADLAAVYGAAAAYFAQLRARVAVRTPDPYLDAAVAALNVAADAVWDDPQQDIMHGAIAWRTRLLGWRGPYLLDDLGWHDRALAHFRSWAGRQNTAPIPEKIPPADVNANLARNEAALHSNGDLSNSHYDMNLVYIDALFRHLRWTGDAALARELWPVIERHLAWERRLFRREFGQEKLPLYEAYAAIWASDDLSYNGGGATHASAYNYDHNLQAARLAGLLGLDAESYRREAAAIAAGMRRFLWLPQAGTFAESKDLLGWQLVHPDPAVWSTYHAVDSGLPTPAEAWQMMRAVDRAIPHLPVRGPGVPTDAKYEVLATTNWMPYTWSLNNVVLGENLHTALAYWQAGRAETAFRLTKGALLASMYLGVCPGNVGTMNLYDVYRRESQRDFADGSGVFSRALVEGLFGVRPDLLADEVTVAPGFPAAWDHAGIVHPDFSLQYERRGLVETYRFTSRFPRAVAVRFQLPRRAEAAEVTVNGTAVATHPAAAPALAPRIEGLAPAAATTEIVVTWRGAAPAGFAEPPDEWARGMQAAEDAAVAVARRSTVDWSRPLAAVDRLETVDLAPYFNDRVTEIFRLGKYQSPRSPFASLALPAQGVGGWAGSVQTLPLIDDRGLRAAAGARGRFVLPNGIPFATPGPGTAPNVVFTSQWDNYPHEVTLPLAGRAARAFLLVAGSTNPLQSRLANGEIVVTYRDGTQARLALENPTTWWPIEQDYFIDDYQFRDPAPLPGRVDLRTGRVRLLTPTRFRGTGTKVEGGAGTLLQLPLDPARELQSCTVRALANEVVIGLMSLTLAR